MLMQYINTFSVDICIVVWTDRRHDMKHKTIANYFKRLRMILQKLYYPLVFQLVFLILDK